LVLAAVLVAGGACIFSPGVETHTVILKESGPAYGFTFLIDKVEIKVDPPLRYEWVEKKEDRTEKTKTDSFSSSNRSIVVRINGLKVEIRDGEFHIGGKSYGPVEAGDRVLVNGDGVFVNEEHKGDL
jgi:hypothetical protein